MSGTLTPGPLPRMLECDAGLPPRPLLCIVIDTEEDFDWHGPFSRRHVRVSSMHSIGRGHAIFRRFGLRPTYLIDYPVIDHPAAPDIFGPWQQADECVIGSQLHPWVTPPYEEVVCPMNSYPSNLDADLQRRKLAVLTTRIREVLGVAPQVYKAGRYGLDLSFEETLSELGYLVDTSILPYRDNSGFAGGPDFFGYPDRPFWTAPGHGLFYLPVTQFLTGPLRGVGRTGFGRWLFGPSASAVHLPGVLARLRLLERIMLSPEGASGDDMRRLTRAMLRDGRRIFALSLHSPSFVPGTTPYVRSAPELERFIATIEGYLEFFFGELGGEAVTPLELREMFAQPAPAPRYATVADAIAAPELHIAGR
ncbi:MAG: glycosyltransferase [Acetobacteraceae bacterium]|nr:glycosyltransferase [Acetobacteraceae bacterium]